MTSRTDSAQANASIAVIGMAGRFPGAPNIEAYWRNLLDGRESVRFFSEEELRADGVTEDELTAADYVRATGWLDRALEFDADYFNYSPLEAGFIDPQHRIFLECAVEALDDAACDPQSREETIGVFAGAAMNIQQLGCAIDEDRRKAGGAARWMLLFGNDKDYLTTRVSYKLNLTGPSVNVQSACSTSLLAIHLACQSLLGGECDVALAGGVSIIRSLFKEGYRYTEGDLLSPDGHCRPFDAAAQGTVFGDGVGIVVLKPLDAAIRDGDRIRAVIRASAVNNDGGDKVGFSAPSVAGQSAVIAEAIALAGVTADAISYVETHGTGTELGDPLEIAGLAAAFRASTDQFGYCGVGSVKGNVGHLYAAAGVAGLIKTIMALEAETLPPTINYSHPNPKIDFSATPFVVQDRASPWIRQAAPRLAGVSSFGIGGTNVHLIVEEPPLETSTPSTRSAQLLSVSARREDALDLATEQLRDYLSAHPATPIEDVAHTLLAGRPRYRHVRSVVCQNAAEAVEALSSPNRAPVITGVRRGGAGRAAFMFPGQGAQQVGMGAGVYKDEPVYRRTFDRCGEILRPHMEIDLADLVFCPSGNEDAEARLTRTEFAQPALFSLQYALAQYWMAMGLRPEALIGHSLGELTAACLAGVLTLEDALRVIAGRGRLMQAMPSGAMLAVLACEDRVREFLPASLSLAAVNGTETCVVSGPSDAIAGFEQDLKALDCGCMRLKTSHAFHSDLMKSAVEPFVTIMKGVSLRAPDIPLISNVTGHWLTPEQATSPDYWAQHLLRPVRFHDGLQTIAAAEIDVFLEVGPGQTLVGLARSSQGARDRIVAIPSLPKRRGTESDRRDLLEAAIRLDMAGVSFDLGGLSSGEVRCKVSLPPYPFQRREYAIRGLGRGRLQSPQEAGATSGERAELYAPSWRRVPSPGTLGPLSPQKWLIFTPDDPFSAAMVAALRAQGHEVATVRAGPDYREDAPGAFSARPGAGEHLEPIFETLGRTRFLPDQVLYLWALGDAPPGAPAREWPIYDLFHIVEAMNHLVGDQLWDLVAISANGQNVVGDEKVVIDGALMSGPCHCLGEELANAKGRYVDVDRADLQKDKADALARQIVSDLQSPDPADTAYRNGRRWIRALDRLDRPERSASRDAASEIRRGGTYLISGGLGGIGLVLARSLFERFEAQLVLVSRTGLPPREQWAEVLNDGAHPRGQTEAVRAILDLEASGAEILVLAADVGSVADMGLAVHTARSRFGGLDGVLHAAGVAGDGIFGGQMIERPDRDVSAVLHPKLAGLNALTEVFAADPIDLLVLFSSISALFGYPGLADYGSANAVLDGCAQGGVPWARRVISINWDSWNEAGMAVAADSAGTVATLKADWLKGGLTNEDALEAFYDIAASDQPQVFVTKARYAPAIWPAARKLSLGVHKNPSHERPDLASAYSPPQTDTEQAAAAILADMLGIDRVGIDDNFLDLGCHSLMATQFTSRMRADTGLSIPIRLFFESLTIRGVMENLEQSDLEEIEI